MCTLAGRREREKENARGARVPLTQRGSIRGGRTHGTRLTDGRNVALLLVPTEHVLSQRIDDAPNKLCVDFVDKRRQAVPQGQGHIDVVRSAKWYSPISDLASYHQLSPVRYTRACSTHHDGSTAICPSRSLDGSASSLVQLGRALSQRKGRPTGTARHEVYYATNASSRVCSPLHSHVLDFTILIVQQQHQFFDNLSNAEMRPPKQAGQALRVSLSEESVPSLCTLKTRDCRAAAHRGCRFASSERPETKHGIGVRIHTPYAACGLQAETRARSAR